MIRGPPTSAGVLLHSPPSNDLRTTYGVVYAALMTQNTAKSREARLARLFSRATTSTLITSLLTVEGKLRRGTSPELNLSRTWLIGELERRYPSASAAVGAAFEKADEQATITGTHPEVDYVGVLVSAIRASGQ
jgi:hypothetical protein